MQPPFDTAAASRPSQPSTSIKMSNFDEDKTIFEHAPPIMLPPHAPETILLLLIISGGLTITLHHANLTHIVGILLLVVIAKINSITFNPVSLDILARLYCLRDTSCHKDTKVQLASLGEQILAWVSGVPPEQTVLDSSGALKEQFQHRAGIFGGLVTFLLIYKFVGGLYSWAYSIAKESSRIPGLEVKIVNGQISRQPSTNLSKSKASGRSNPLISPDNTDNELPLPIPSNPLRVPKELTENTSCMACEELENAQAGWADAVRQYREAGETILEEKNSLTEQVNRLKGQMTMLRRENSEMRMEAKDQDDRIEYLNVLLKEAGKQLGYDSETDVRDMLWKAYSRRQGIASTNAGSEDIVVTDSNSESPGTDGSAPVVEVRSNPALLIGDRLVKTVEAIVEERVSDEA